MDRHVIASMGAELGATTKTSFTVHHRLSPRQVQDVLAGGLIPRLAEEVKEGN